MTTYHKYEDENWTVVARHKVGKLDKKDVTLTFKKVKAADSSESEVETAKKKIEKDLGEARHTLAAPKVPDDEPSYRLVVDAEFHRYIGKDKAQRLPSDCVVWPRTYTVVAKDESSGAVREGFEYKAKQGPHDHTPPKTTAQGKSEFRLKQDPGEVKLTSVTPWEIVETKKDPKKLRQVELKVRRNFTPEVIKPTKRDDAQPHKQFVNLDSASDGQDQLSHAVTVVVGVQADPSGVKGRKGDTIFIQVKFGRETGRDTPKPALLAPVQDIVESDAGKTWKGKVVLAADGATCDVKLELGYAGGETAKLYLSSVKDGFTDPPNLEFVNWRRLHYELMYCDVLESVMTAAASGGGHDFPSAMRTLIESRLAGVFLEYVRTKGLKYTLAQAPAGTVVEGDFIDQPGAKRVILGGRLSGDDPVAFSAENNNTIHIKMASATYSTNGSDNPQSPTLDASPFVWTSTKYLVPLDVDVSGCTWEAQIPDPEIWKKPPELTFADTGAATAATSPYAFTLTEPAQGKSLVLTFARGQGGTPAEALAPSEAAKIEPWVKSLLDAATLKANGNAVTIRVSHPNDAGNRLALVHSRLRSAFDAEKKPIYAHPGLELDGTKKSGAVDEAWFAEKKIQQAEITLPTAGDGSEPGDFVGPLDDTHCPVKVNFKV
jgi:hypothetical protein